MGIQKTACWDLTPKEYVTILLEFINSDWATPVINEESVAIRHEVEIKGGLKALKDKGLKITHYEEHIPK